MLILQAPHRAPSPCRGPAARLAAAIALALPAGGEAVISGQLDGPRAEGAAERNAFSRLFASPLVPPGVSTAAPLPVEESRVAARVIVPLR